MGCCFSLLYYLIELVIFGSFTQGYLEHRFHCADSRIFSGNVEPHLTIYVHLCILGLVKNRPSCSVIGDHVTCVA